MKDIAAHELPILVPDSGPLSGVSTTGPTASTSGLYVFNVGIVEHRAIPNLKPDDLVVFSLELVFAHARLKYLPLYAHATPPTSPSLGWAHL